jgi:cholesterol oxidase
MSERYDAIVVGSGFGGAIAACRLAEAGYRVLVLERGRRWRPEEFPRVLGDPWRWDEAHPERENGWIDFRIFRHMAVAQGAAVGGGSHIYANISVEATPATFESGWPPEITYHELAPHYGAVAATMNVQPVPPAQWPPRTALMREAATATGYADRFRPLDLAVNFDPGWDPAASEARDPARSRRFTNVEGIEQGTCVHLGECDIGCPVLARNTLDMNYIPRAERHGAVVRPLHIVRTIQRAGDGYRVQADRIEDRKLVPVTEEARIVIVAAGSLGSTELLLRCRDVSKTLPDLPRSLGAGWSSNGDFLTIGLHKGRRVDPTRGPTITSAIDFRDGSIDGHSFIIEDGGFPDVVGRWMTHASTRWSWFRRERILYRGFQQAVQESAPFASVMPWFAQGRDAADGQLELRRRWWGLFGRLRLSLDWDVTASRPTIEAIIAMHRRLAESTGGTPIVPLSWSWLGYLITPHPLGGCNMGTDPSASVVDHRGEVWGHRNLYVIDGSIVPEALGANPSRTIAALAERSAAILIGEGR